MKQGLRTGEMKVESIANINMPIQMKERMKAILESQQMRKLKNLEDPLMKSEEIENEYKCVKCRDMTFIIDDGVAISIAFLNNS